MSNGFEEFAKAAKNLAKALDDRQEDLADALRSKIQEKQLETGEKTSEEVFAENVEYAQGNMISLFCSVCGNRISLHEKLSEGYCEFCGEKIALKAALRGEMEKTAIENISGKDLYELATKSGSPRIELVEAAAKKGCVEANRMMAYHYLEENNEKALTFAQAGAKQGDIDCQGYEIALKGILGKITDAAGAINKLDEYRKKGFATKEAKNVCEKTRETLQIVLNDFRERERSAERERAAREEAEFYRRRLREEEEKRKKLESQEFDFVVVPRIDVSDM